jgi:aspartyl-tRNA(Asn)/glutamyl-tRNA(Gln) amidotransferase subunit A
MPTRREFIQGVAGAVPALALSSPGDNTGMTIAEAAELIRQRKLSPVELTKACLSRINALNRELNAFITVTDELALSRAKSLEAELPARGPRSPLHGIPVALKDLIDTAGVKTTAGSALWADRVPTMDAAVVKSLEAAGAILVGKTNMDEFAYNFTSETSHYGAIRNPWDKRRSPGGSSGGSAVAVAAGMCFAALGSDTGGSIRLPAALCGITGFKPTYGKVPTDGVAPLAWSMDHVGPMCRTARDAALVLEAISSPAARFSARKLKQVRLGIVRKPYFSGIDEEVEHATARAVEQLARLCSGANEVDLPILPAFENWPDLPRTYSVLISAEAYAYHRPTLGRSEGLYHPGTRLMLQGGADIGAADYIEARREMEALRDASHDLFSKADILITPAAPGPAFELGKPASLVFLRNCAPWNLYGLPCISIPCGFSQDGLPLGMQLTGPSGSDSLVLALASAYQSRTDWHARRPPC